VLHGTVPSGDSFPTTHGNTIGLMTLWNYIIKQEYGWDLMMEELKTRDDPMTYGLPLRFNFCGDDTIFTGPNVILKHLSEVVLPQYFVTDGLEDHGAGTVMRDLVVGGIE
jgi:hypothetical protein